MVLRHSACRVSGAHLHENVHVRSECCNSGNPETDLVVSEIEFRSLESEAATKAPTPYGRMFG